MSRTFGLIGVVALAAAAAACGKERSQCEVDAEALARLMAEAHAEPAVALIDATDELVARPDLPKIRILPWGSEIRLTANGIDLDGRAVADKEELAARLPSSSGGSQATRDRGAVQLFIAPSVPWATVVDAVTSASRAGYDAPVFVFRGPAPEGKAPRRTPMDDKLDATLVLSFEERIAELTRLTNGLTNSCPALGRVFAKPAEVFDVAYTDVTIRNIPQALVECGCKVDLPSLRSLMWFLLWNPHPSRAIAFEHDAPAETTIALPAGMPWSEAHKQLTPAIRKAKLVVR